ncbi:hypothetical protein ACQEVF_08515 [Nonomuraea polychroma]|uniref:hypothetical protein n=1 Tax=Nonomuraea polychroma TaxID=46176 RepID=UPI003D8B3674
MTVLLSLLGLNNSGGRRAGLKRKIAALGIDTGHFRRVSPSKYTTERLSAAVGASTSINGVLNYLGIPHGGGAHSHISRRIKALGLDISHFSHVQGASANSHQQFDRGTLERAADGARSMREILRRLGMPESGSAREKIRRRLHAYGLPNRPNFGASGSARRTSDRPPRRHARSCR